MEKRSTPKIALACDWLTTPGGAEKVLLELHHMYPDAPIYTSQYSKKGINWFDNADVHIGWLQVFPKGLRKFLGPLRQLYFSHLDLSDYDIVISVTGAEAKAIKTSGFHLCYCHVPTQYYWQMYDKYVENPGFGILNPLVRFMFKLLVKPLRQADYNSAQRPNQFVTISNYAREQIQKYYHCDAAIVAPPVEVDKFFHKSDQVLHNKQELIHNSNQLIHKKSTRNPQSYFIIACRQVTWKRVDLAIKACQKLHLHLKVVGDGSEHKRLVKLADDSPYIEFIPWTETGELAKLLHDAEAYLFPSLEPFGVAAVEALAAGCPVIAYAKGGSQDFIQDRKNGLLFPEQTVDSLAKAISEFQTVKFDRSKISQTAQKFSPQHFRQGIKNLIQKESHP